MTSNSIAQVIREEQNENRKGSFVAAIIYLYSITILYFFLNSIFFLLRYALMNTTIEFKAILPLVSKYTVYAGTALANMYYVGTVKNKTNVNDTRNKNTDDNYKIE